MTVPRWIAVLPVLSACAAALGAGAEARIVWVEGKPRVEVRVDVAPPEGLKELPLAVSLFDAQGKRLWGTAAKVPLGEGPRAAVEVLLEGIADPAALHRVEVGIDQPALGLRYAEQLHFARPDQPVPWYALRRSGAFPGERITAAVALAGVRGEESRAAQVSFVLRDADGNVVMDKAVKADLSEAVTAHAVEVVPGEGAVGPFTLEYRVECDPLGWYFEASRPFALSNALVPVSSFEVDDRTWSALPDTADAPVPEPRVAYDREVFHSGRQSLRIDYLPGRVEVFGAVVLPGQPTAAWLWVKGNGSGDLLYLNWHDHFETTRAHWLRFPNTLRVPVCSLDFDGWRRFRVPVLGDGMAKVSPHGCTEEIDSPIYVASLEVHGRGKAPKAGEPPPRQSVWVDDLAVETQVRPTGQVSMELRADVPDRLLHAGSRLYVAVGNGHAADLDGGSLRVVAKDRDGKVVQQTTQALAVAAGSFAVAEVPLAEAFAASPRGPVDVDVQFAAPGAAGLRAGGRITFKSPTSYGLAWDFEHPQAYSGLDANAHGLLVVTGAVGGQTAAGGAAGSAAALRVPVDPAKGGAVLLHPVLPGKVDRIDLLVRAEGGPVVLQPVLLDSGQTGHTNKGHNAFWLPPVRVDWSDWREVQLVAPAIPARHDLPNAYFLNEPFYPLNLALVAKPAGETPAPAAVFVDNVRVRTHLPEEEELQGEVLFPDDTMIHPPGAPLEIALTNFALAERKIALDFRLESYQGHVAAEGRAELAVPPAGKVVHRLVGSLKPGMYVLTVAGLGGRTVREHVQVLDAAKHFGPQPLEFLQRLPEIRKGLGMTEVKVYLDWDNTEGVPGLLHYHWFEVSLEAASAGGAYRPVPVVGFAADWAGSHQQEPIARGEYSRYIGDILQVPVRMVDWSRFVRACAREYKGRFGKWVFWENPDLASSPQGVAPQRYAEMLGIFHQWVGLYDPKAKIVAGGFNMDRVLGYLEGLEAPHELPFDEMVVQMSLGELAPEAADVEGLLDELGELLQTARSGKVVRLAEMDWPIGQYVSPAEQAAYHSRAALILHSRGAPLHEFGLVNPGASFEGPGVLHRRPYGSSEYIQILKPVHAPKPAYFALRFAQDFLAGWKFARSVTVHDFDRRANRAFLYTNSAGQVAAAVWRAAGAARTYTVPPAWKDVRAVDAFGFDVSLADGLRCAALPTFLTFPPSVGLAEAMHGLRTLQPADGADPIALALYPAEEDSARRARYAAEGGAERREAYGQVPGGRKLRETFLEQLRSERFEFTLAEAGDALLTRLWRFEGDGQKLTVRLNDGPPAQWDLTRGKLSGADAGIRESSFVLRGCRAGTNAVQVAYEQPGNCAAWRVEPLAGGEIDLCRWGVLAAMQAKGQLQKFRSVVGTPLAIGKTRYATGLGTHAASLIEVPLDGQFSAFEATVGVDASTDGRGTVVFEILVDGVRKAHTEVLNGFSKPVTLKVEGLQTARRMALLVTDGGDRNADDLANWVDAKLILKE